MTINDGAMYTLSDIPGDTTGGYLMNYQPTITGIPPEV